MAKQSKRFRALAEKRKEDNALPVAEAVKTLKGFEGTKFDQSVEIAIRLGIDNTQAEQINFVEYYGPDFNAAAGLGTCEIWIGLAD